MLSDLQRRQNKRVTQLNYSDLSAFTQFLSTFGRETLQTGVATSGKVFPLRPHVYTNSWERCSSTTEPGLETNKTTMAKAGIKTGTNNLLDSH